MTDFQIKVSMLPLIDQHYWPNVFVKNILKEIFLHIYKNLLWIFNQNLDYQGTRFWKWAVNFVIIWRKILYSMTENVVSFKIFFKIIFGQFQSLLNFKSFEMTIK